jgi:uncharacterized delta-60 repeat protein
MKGESMNKYKMLFVFIITLYSLLPALLYSQSVDTAWVRFYKGPGNGWDKSYALTVDNTGNVYVTGTSYGNSWDCATVKYSPTGESLWARRYDGPAQGEDELYAIACDYTGNVYVTGGSADSVNYWDCVTIKYNSAGATQWIARYDGIGHDDDWANDIVLDGAGNVYITGTSVSTWPTFNIVTIKYNTAGVEQWVKRYSGTAGTINEAYAIERDNLDNIYVSGTKNRVNGPYSSDIITIKYNSNGDTLWTRTYAGPNPAGLEEAYDLVVDNSHNVYITGKTSSNGDDCITIKYNSAGETAWVRTYNGTASYGDYGAAIALDGSNNVFVAGMCNDTIGSTDCLLIKYNTSGQTLWTRNYNYTGSRPDWANDVAVDGSGNAYITGMTNAGSATTNCDFLTVKFNSTGIVEWVKRYNHSVNEDDEAFDIALDNSGNVYVTGAAGNGAWATIKYVQGSEIEENSPVNQLNLPRKIYPNPAKTYFTVRIPQSVDRSEVKVIDVTGKIVKSEELKGKSNRFSLDGIKNGIYFVKVNDEIMKEKLVVTK